MKSEDAEALVASG